jgi:hypothetical protein
MNANIAQKTVVITGASSGMGAAAARHLAGQAPTPSLPRGEWKGSKRSWTRSRERAASVSLSPST